MSNTKAIQELRNQVDSLAALTEYLDVLDSKLKNNTAGDGVEMHLRGQRKKQIENITQVKFNMLQTLQLLPQ